MKPLLPSLLLAASLAQAADAPNSALQRGLFEEEANQNLDAAIAAYQSVLAGHEDQRKLAATALFRLGECYRKLGRTNDAVVQYRRVVRDFGDQTNLVTLSRQNLIGLGANEPLLRAGQDQASGKPELTPAQIEAQRLLIERLELEIKSTEAKLTRQKELIRQNVAPLSSGDEMEARLLDLRRQLILAQDTGPASTRESVAVAGMNALARAQLKELLRGELKIAEQFAAEQRKRVETGTLAPGDQVRFERDVLGLKRQLVAVDGLSSNEDRQQWRELLSQEIKLAEESVKFEKQRLEAGRSMASEVARLQRDVLILKRELITFDATPAGVSESSAPRQRLQAVVERAASTDDEEREIRRIQALIRDSPDLINAANDSMTPLQLAAWNGQLVVARFLLENGANVDQRSIGEGKTALFLAAAQGHKSMVELLLASGANPNVKEQYGNTALHEAAAKGFITVVEVLLANKAELENRNNSGETPFQRAAGAGQAAMIEMLLKRGANPNTRRNNGDTPLHLAAERGDVATIRLLLKNGAEVNARNKNGVPPLGDALVRGGTVSVEAVQALLENGATTDFVVNGDSPVHSAVRRDSVELLQLLLKYKAAPDLPNSQGLTPLQSVVVDQRRPGKPEMIPLLIQAGANPNTPLPASTKVTIHERRGVSREQPLAQYPILIAAIVQRDLPRVEALLANGADVNAFVPDGNYESTALMFAIYYDSLVVLEALLQNKPNLEARTRNEGRTALHQAAARTETTGVEFANALIKAGARLDATDKKGWTPLHIAARDGKTELVKALLEAGANPNIQAEDGALPLSLARRTSGQTVLSDAVRQEVSKILLEHGADESLLRRRTIAVTRRGQNYESVVFRRGTNDFNHHTLYELIAGVYRPEWPKQYVSFPDLRQIAIERVDGASRPRQILVDVEARATQGSCTDDFLEWGDRVEIRESEHALNANWPGLDGTIVTNLSRCLARSVELIVKGRTNRTELRASALFASQTFGPDGRFLNGYNIVQDSFRLSDVLRRSGLLLTTSDLARVRVHRRDPIALTPQEWVLDETKPDPETDFWVRDGDVIEVPEK